MAEREEAGRPREELTAPGRRDGLKFASEGYLPAAVPVVAGAVAGPLISWYLGVPLLVFGLLVLLFFRDPARTPEGGDDAVISPADGRVVDVRTGEAAHRLEPGAPQRVSIFMSPLDVHVNRAPVSGTIESVEYREGRFKAAYGENASDTNESNAMVVRAADGTRMVVVQIAGWLARRIICDVRKGDAVQQGKRFGLIMFGSRVDVHLAPGVTIEVAPGQRVRAGRTVIARRSSAAGGEAEAS